MTSFTSKPLILTLALGIHPLSRLLYPLSTGQRVLGRRRVRSIIVGAVFVALILLLALFTPIQQILVSTLRPESPSRTSNLPPISVATTISTPTPLLYPTPTQAQSESLASAPECPLGPQPQDIAPQYFAAAIGSTPIWVVGFVGPHATIHIDTRNSRYTRCGWAARVIFVIKPGYTSPGTISGRNIADGNPFMAAGRCANAASLLIFRSTLSRSTLSGKLWRVDTVAELPVYPRSWLL